MQRDTKLTNQSNLHQNSLSYEKENIVETSLLHGDAAPSKLLTPLSIMQLQRTVGNQAVHQLLKKQLPNQIHGPSQQQVIQAKLGYNIISNPDYVDDPMSIYDAPNGKEVKNEEEEYFTGQGVEVTDEKKKWSEFREPQDDENSDDENSKDEISDSQEDNEQKSLRWTQSDNLSYQPQPDQLDATWSKSNGELYKKRKKKGKIPAMTDVFQGDLCDCFFLAPLAAIAGTPKGKDLIKAMIKTLGGDNFEVGFHNINEDNTINKKRETETVDTWFPETESGEKFLYNPGGKKIADLEVPIWSAIIEKAYAQWDDDGYAGLNMENASRAIAHLTGLEPEFIEWDDKSKKILEKVAWRSDTFSQELQDDDMESESDEGAVKPNVEDGQLFSALKETRKDPNIAVVAESLSGTGDDNDYLDEEYQIKDTHVYILTVVKDDRVTLWDPQGKQPTTLPIAKFKNLFNRVLKVNVADAQSL